MNLSEDFRKGKKILKIGIPSPNIEPYIKTYTNFLAKSATSEKIRFLKQNLSYLKMKGESQEEYENSLNLLQIKSRQVAHTFEDRVSLFESNLEEKNRQAEEFVKKM